MSGSKKQVRLEFRLAVFERDAYRCRCCGKQGRDRQDGDEKAAHAGAPEALLAILDAHHICNRNLMPFGGYVKENGISVCEECHLKAEEYWRTGKAVPGFSPEELYELIGSSFDLAFQISEQELSDGA